MYLQLTLHFNADSNCVQDATRMQDILKVLADGSAALNGLHASQSMSSETIDTLLDSISESIDHQQDIDQALSDCSSIQVRQCTEHDLYNIKMTSNEGNGHRLGTRIG